MGVETLMRYKNWALSYKVSYQVKLTGVYTILHQAQKVRDLPSRSEFKYKKSRVTASTVRYVSCDTAGNDRKRSIQTVVIRNESQLTAMINLFRVTQVLFFAWHRLRAEKGVTEKSECSGFACHVIFYPTCMYICVCACIHVKIIGHKILEYPVSEHSPPPAPPRFCPYTGNCSWNVLP
jgi:hypothetical protein